MIADERDLRFGMCVEPVTLKDIDHPLDGLCSQNNA
jgi:hypothetical protein